MAIHTHKPKQIAPKSGISKKLKEKVKEVLKKKTTKKSHGVKDAKAGTKKKGRK